MKNHENKNGFFEVVALIVVCLIAVFTVWVFVALAKESEAKTKDFQTELQKYADENDLPLGIRITRIRGCQYLEGRYDSGFTMTHMGDCDNPIHLYNAVPKTQLER